MGLTAGSTGTRAIDKGLKIRRSKNEYIVALAGNPNVGKSTVFNQLTGMNQHTGNWAGKTVTNAVGECSRNGRKYSIVDIPGTYSLMAHSAEEEVARDFICFGGSDCVVVVCDATCLERNLNLVLQTMEITHKVVVCVNLVDEAEKKRISIDFGELEKQLGVPVIPTAARANKGLDKLMQAVEEVCTKVNPEGCSVRYIKPIEKAIEIVRSASDFYIEKKLNPRWAALKLLEDDEKLIKSMESFTECHLSDNAEIEAALERAREYLSVNLISEEELSDKTVSCIVLAAEGICNDCIYTKCCGYSQRDRKIDRFLTNKWIGIPVMVILLMGIFWLTITGANYPSQLLSQFFGFAEEKLADFFIWTTAPQWVSEMLVQGVFRVTGWIIAVMLPPMAIFFPLFTLLEDLGYLPRVAFNLDKYFKKSGACGKQSLTMCMGLGCNAAGVVGARIIDSSRERLIAVITNALVPCNGRFPTLIALITVFFAMSFTGITQSVVSTLILGGAIVLSVAVTLAASRILSKTILRGEPSSFTLELPPYRRPQIGKVIVRSIFDRTLFVLGRAVAVAAPAGLLIWIMANLTVGDKSVLTYCSDFLDPFASLLGLDGVILLAFILGMPANEIVLPIMLMAYLSTGSLAEYSSLSELGGLLADNGWSWVTAVSFMLFSLFHFPCTTTLLTIKKETKSLKWTFVSFIFPTLIGIALCMAFNAVVLF